MTDATDREIVIAVRLAAAAISAGAAGSGTALRIDGHWYLVGVEPSALEGRESAK